MITKESVQRIQSKIKLAIASIEKEENIKIDFGITKSTPTNFVSQIHVNSLDSKDSLEVSNLYLEMSKRLGFSQNIIGLKFATEKGHREVIDIKLKNRKYPIIVKTLDGRQYKYSTDGIKRAVGGDKIINRNLNLDKLIND